MDSNDSLKHILCHIAEDEDSHELPTTQKVPTTHYLSCEFVDSFAQSAPIQSISKDIEISSSLNSLTWGVYDETGIFLAICWHGISLLIADMVQSRELAKYPIAIVSRLMKVFRANLGGGYNIGCQFSTTLAKSVIGKDVEQNQHTCLVPAFHGHDHQTFSKSNALASSLHYASAFHCQQATNMYFSHNDAYEVYVSILNFIYSNYKQALSIIQDCEFVLPLLKCELGLTTDTEFTTWLQEEQSYLEGLEMEPLNETLQMEYWQALVNLKVSKKDLDLKSVLWDVTTPSDPKDYATYMCKIRKAETACQHAIEMYNKDLHIAQDLETTGYKMWKHIVKALQVCSSAICIALEQYNTAAHAMDPPCCILKWDKVVEYAFITEFNLLRDAQQDMSQQPWVTLAGCSTEIKCLEVEAHRLLTYLRDEECFLDESKQQA
ncbi:hypothetical protein BKA82DRAFT_4331281 [Pisolithus tinctorius]|nr:hypothetical protein BKA82DRAFT_4331281 [Pisolithus tinctorius]